MPKKIIVILTLLLAGCAALNNTNSDNVAKLISRYCLLTNEQFRTNLKQKINHKLNGFATISVTCRR